MGSRRTGELWSCRTGEPPNWLRHACHRWKVGEIHRHLVPGSPFPASSRRSSLSDAEGICDSEPELPALNQYAMRVIDPCSGMHCQ